MLPGLSTTVVDVSTKRPDLPTFRDLIYPTLKAVDALGGSASNREIDAQVIEAEDVGDETLALASEKRPERSLYLHRLGWSRHYAYRGGLLDNPRKGLFLLTPLGRETLGMPAEEGAKRCVDIARKYQKELRQKRQSRRDLDGTVETEDEAEDETAVTEDDDSWKARVLLRLHALSPLAFEHFVVYLLKAHGLELKHVGGTGDQGIDAIDLAPVSLVLNARVAVQAKRYDPNTSIRREVVSLLRSDAMTAGAERAVFVTLGRFSEPARDVAKAATPYVDLIDGDRLAELMLKEGVGLVMRPDIDEDFFAQFGD